MSVKVATLLLAAACTTPPPPARDAAADPLAFALVTSPPGTWARALPPVLELGPRAVPALLRALEATPDGPGAQPAIAALGVLDDGAAVPALAGYLQGDDEDLAAEAALAMGRLPAPEVEQPLEAAMRRTDGPVYVRTAAAAALVERGDRSVAIGFLCDVILAGTAAGRAHGATIGLPVDRVRWAVERNLAIDALRRAAPAGAFELDADASWPRLAAGVALARRHFGLSQ